MLEPELRSAWQEPVHADYFDARAKMSLPELRCNYEQFHEFRLFCAHKSEIQGRTLVEIACATGELYRYLQHYHPEFHYYGFDISQPAIARAQQKYPAGRFAVCQPNLTDISKAQLQPAVVWARDVVHHQPQPFVYLQTLLALSQEVTILRLRTRDRGATVLDPELSCQYHYNHWVPYIVMNLEEVINTICQTIPVAQLRILKRPEQLGGWHNRFLPKECYYPETGTAETAVYILRAPTPDATPEIEILTQPEVQDPLPQGRLSRWRQRLGALYRRGR